MTAQSQLKQQLRALKLSGILDTLDMRIADAQNNQLDYKSFFSLLLQDEIEARQGRKLKRLIRQAHFGNEQTLENFDFSLSQGINPTLIRELATTSFITKGQGVIFTGPPGTGKTHLAKALGHAACRHGYLVSFYKFHDLFSELVKADLKGQVDRLISKLIKQDLIIIDDFAFRRIDLQSSEFLYNIIDNRYGSKSLILTSNRAIADWMEVFPDPVVAGAILDRITHQAHQIQLTGESIRKKIGLKKMN